jgi:hypothetical protein
VAVLFEREGGGGLKGKLIGDNAGGVTVEATGKQGARTFFVPWTAVRYVEILKEPDEIPEDLAP